MYGALAPVEKFGRNFAFGLIKRLIKRVSFESN